MRSMELKCLLLCRDQETLRVFRRALDDLEIKVEVSNAATAAMELLDTSKFDAIIVDCDDVAGGTEILTGLQRSPSNKRAIGIAVIHGTTSMRSAFEMGAHFALDKPVTYERAARALRAAHGFMVTEQRRYFRHALDTRGYLSFGVVKDLACKVTNVSGGGMAVALAEQISSNSMVDVRFELPGITEMVEAKGEFAWSDGEGHAGIRFVYVSIDSKRWLGKWLSERIEEIEPSSPAGKGNGRRPVVV